MGFQRDEKYALRYGETGDVFESAKEKAQDICPKGGMFEAFPFHGLIFGG